MTIDHEDCLFFHVVDLPDGETTSGHWDFRATASAYHGHVHFAGKSVLEIGAATGSHSFWLEGQGARVTPYDLSPHHSWDILPTCRQDAAEVERAMRALIGQINHGWHYCAERLGSTLHLEHGTIYDIPVALGDFDIVTFGSVLLHARDPVGALQRAAERATEAVVITDRYPTTLDTTRPLMEFMPTLGREMAWGGWTWWWITPPVFQNLLTIIGFRSFELSVSKHLHALSGQEIELFTLVARR